jgi:hypothetical protein
MNRQAVLLFVFVTAIVVVVGGGASGVAVAQPAPASARDALLTMDDLREQFKQEKYQDVLKHIQRLLQLKGDAATAYDRYDLFCLRGESFLRIKSMTLAADAFNDAAETAKDDSKKQGVAKGTAVLIRRSKQVGYVPRPAKAERGKPPPPPPAPMQIIEKADRQAAFTRLLEDERAAVVPKLEAAQNGTSLPSIVDVARLLSDLQAVEIAATGKDDQTQAMTKDLVAKAHDLIATALDSMNDRLEDAFRVAKTEHWAIYEGTLRKNFNGRTGLNDERARAVVYAVDQTKLIAPAAAELSRVTGSAALRRDAEVAQKLHDRAVYVRDFNYSSLNQKGRAVSPAPKAG